MTKRSAYAPPFTITPAIPRLIADIGEAVGRASAQLESGVDLRLRRTSRIRTIHGSLAIEGNTLTEEQITAILDGKRVLAPQRDIQEVRNAIAAYSHFDQWDPHREEDLLKAHGTLMASLVEEAGCYRQGNVGVAAGGHVLHIAPPAARVPQLMRSLLHWLNTTEHHPLIASSVFHYEFEFIHPFSDGNGRLGRLWQTLILFRWNPLFSRVPVESLVHAQQHSYYDVLRQSTRGSDCAPFVEFMLATILDAVVTTFAPQVTPQVTPQVERVLQALAKAESGSLTRVALQNAVGLRDRKSFQERWLGPTLEAGLVEMTLRDKPNSRLQQYRLTDVGQRALRALPR